MATKIIELTGVGPVTLVKRTQNRNLRLSVTARGVRVSMPRWTPFSAGATFAAAHIQWIQAELAKQAKPLLESGQRIGKLHYVRFEQVLSGQSIISRVTATEVVVRMQLGERPSDPVVQKRAQLAATRALKREAERLLPPRVRNLATAHDRTYRNVGVKSLRRRWGSCDSQGNLVFNLYLMELPWECIDYVILHELAHTVEMNHEPAFWRLLSSMQPNARALAKQLRSYHPMLQSLVTP